MPWPHATDSQWDFVTLLLHRATGDLTATTDWKRPTGPGSTPAHNLAASFLLESFAVTMSLPLASAGLHAQPLAPKRQADDMLPFCEAEF